MELRHIRYFVGVSEAGSLLKASARLHIAQPALGQQIAALEHDVGARLFDRSSRGVTLTEAGKAFLEHAKVLLADVERARAAVRESSRVPAGDVAIGLPTTVALIATVPILQACRDQLPQVRIKVIEAYSGFLREWLVSGRLDLALLFGDQLGHGARQAGAARRPPGLRVEPARCRPRRAAWPCPHCHGGRSCCRGATTVCAASSTTPASREGIELNVVAEIESLPSVKRAVEAGLGSTILPLGAVADEVAAGRLRASTIDSPSMSRRVVCATSVTRPGTAAAARRDARWSAKSCGRWWKTAAGRRAGSAAGRRDRCRRRAVEPWLVPSVTGPSRGPEGSCPDSSGSSDRTPT